MNVAPVGWQENVDNGLSARAGVHFVNKTTTVCWSHGDSSPRSVHIALVYNPTFDMLHKTFNLHLERAVIDSSQRKDGQGGFTKVALGEPLQLMIEDTDMDTGVVSVDVEDHSGQHVFLFTLRSDSDTALIPVRRIGGNEMDLCVSYEATSWPSGSGSGSGSGREEAVELISLPIVVQTRDGSNGANDLCGQGLSGCEEADSDVKCENGVCTLVQNVNATKASEATSWLAADGDYLGVSGELCWKHGDSAVKKISIPLFRTFTEAHELYRTFRVLLHGGKVEHEGQGLYYAIMLPPILPDASMYKAVSECHPDICLEEKEVVASCGRHKCSYALSSEAAVVLVNAPGPGYLRLVNTTYFVPEHLPQGKIMMAVQRVGGSSGNITVAFSAFASRHGEAIAEPGVDYKNVSGVLEWLDGDEEEKTIIVPILNDEYYVKGRLLKSFDIVIFDPVGGATLLQSRASTIIVDDDVRPGSIEFLDTINSAVESDGNLTLRVVRTGGDDTAVFVRYHTGFSPMATAPLQPVATAHSRRLVQQTYGCRTMLQGQAFASNSNDKASAAFDSDPSTFWGEHLRGRQSISLGYHFSACTLPGALVKSYTMFMGKDDIGSGCPEQWVMQARTSTSPWVTLDEQEHQTCNSDGHKYTLDPQKAGHFSHYRWVFKGNSGGTVPIQIREIYLELAGEQSASNLVERVICDANNTCCEYGSGLCTAASLSPDLVHFPLFGVSPDYAYSEGVLEWAEGDSSVKTISVPIVDDCLGCSGATCFQAGQTHDRPIESIPVQLTLPSDEEIRILTTAPAAYPFRRPVTINKNFAVATALIQDDDGPGVLVLKALSCGAQGGRKIPHVKNFVDQGINKFDAVCPVLEDAGMVDLSVSRLWGNRGVVSVRYSVESVTAVAEVDFTPHSGTLLWNDRDSSTKTISVPIFERPGFDIEDYERVFQVRLHAETADENGIAMVAGGAALYTCAKAISGVCVDSDWDRVNVTIIDSDANPGMLVVENDTYIVDQSKGSVVIGVARIGGTDFDLRLKYGTLPANVNSAKATACQDGSMSNCHYYPTSGDLHWDHGDSQVKNITVRLTDHGMRSPYVTFQLQMVGNSNDTIHPCGGYARSFSENTLEFPYRGIYCAEYSSKAEIRILASTAGGSGYLKMRVYDWPPVVVNSFGSNWAAIAVDRMGGNSGVVSVKAETIASSSAVQGQHFNRLRTSFQWSDGDSDPRVIAISVIPDSIPRDTMVELQARLTSASLNSGLDVDALSTRIFIRSSRFTPKFLSMAISETSTVQHEMNSILLVFSTNVMMGPGAVITVSGLVNTGDVGGPDLNLEGEGASVFGSVVQLDRLEGQARLQVMPGQILLPDQSFALRFQVKNGANAQRLQRIFISASGDSFCPQESVNGMQLSCPEPVIIRSTEMVGLILSFETKAFEASASSSLCSYSPCRASEFYGAENMILVDMVVPEAEGSLPGGTQISFLGLEASSSETGRTSATIVNLREENVGIGSANASAICSCKTPKCACEHVFTGLPLNVSVHLQAKLQCNAFGRVAQGVDEVRVRIGSELFTLKDHLQQPTRRCERNCSWYHDLLAPGFDVSSHISRLGELFVSIESNAEVDLCNEGNIVHGLLRLDWTSGPEVIHSTVVEASWNALTGRIDLSIPSGMSAVDKLSVAFPLRNPLLFHSGSQMLVQVRTPQGTRYGPAPAKGSVLHASRQASIKHFDIGESPQGAIIVLELRIGFNGQIGGSPTGVWITISGLSNYASPSTSILKLQACRDCPSAPSDWYATVESTDLAKYIQAPEAASARWDQATGRLSFYLRAPGPTYLVDESILKARLELRNANKATTGPLPTVSVDGSLVVGTSSNPAAQHASSSVLTAHDGAHPLMAHVDYIPSTGYSHPKIVLKLTMNYDVMHGDVVTLMAPRLTVCDTFCYEGRCARQETACAVSPLSFYVRLANANMSGAGDGTDFMSATWYEQDKRLELHLSGGRALCRGQEAFVSLTLDHCAKMSISVSDECRFQVLPDDLEASMEASVKTTIAGCVNSSGCASVGTSSISNSLVETKMGYYWGHLTYETRKYNGSEDCKELESAVGRTYFTAQVHNGSMFALGGLTNCDGDAAREARVSDDGLTWRSAGKAPPWPRIFFSSVSFRGYMWVLGGHDFSEKVRHDVWRSTDATHWELVHASAPWEPRMSHASLVFQDKIWIIAGSNQKQSSLCDVWSTRDGRAWTLVSSCAPFSPRFSHVATVFASKMWVYGGNTDTADVWWSRNGQNWTAATTSAAWGHRRLSDGLTFDGRLWLRAGVVTDTTTNKEQALTDLWYSSDGSTWEIASFLPRVTAESDPREGAQFLVFQNRSFSPIVCSVVYDPSSKCSVCCVLMSMTPVTCTVCFGRRFNYTCDA